MAEHNEPSPSVGPLLIGVM